MLHRALLAVSFAIAVVGSGCEGAPVEGEGEGREGEGEDECGRNGDCALGNVCVDGDCVFGCEEDRDCPGGFSCDVDAGDHGACVEIVSEGEGEGDEGEGEGDVGEGEGEGDVGEGEGEGDVGEGEGEGEGDGGVPVDTGAGTCANVLTAVSGVNEGFIVDRRSQQDGSCNSGRGGDDVWRYTADVPGSVVVAVAHAVDATVAVDLFAVDACDVPGDNDAVEFDCDAAINDDRVVVQLPPGEDTVDFIVDAFLLHSAGAYTLTIDSPEVVGTGEACDDFRFCAASDTCVGGFCVDDADVFCASEVEVGVGGFLLEAQGVTDGPSCGADLSDRPAVAVTHTMARTGALVVRGFDFAAQVRDDCGGADVVCGSLDFADFVLPDVNAGDVVHFALFPNFGTQVQFEIAERLQLPSDAPCNPFDIDAVCGPPDECLGLPGQETCTERRFIDLHDPCDPNDTSEVCVTGQCLRVGAGNECIDPLVDLCAASTVAVGGTQTVDLDAAFDGTFLSCSFGNTPDRALRYTVINPAALVRVQATTVANNTVSVALRAECDVEDDLFCDQAFQAPSVVTSSPLRAGDAIDIIVEADRDVTLTITELVLREVDAGDICDPESINELCVAGTACLGGPSPRGFRCVSATVGDDGDDCVEGSTDAVCGAGLVCDVDTCVAPPATTSGTVNGQLLATPIAPNRVRDGCRLDNGTNFNFTRFAVVNPGDVDASVVVNTIAPNEDTVLGAYIPTYDSDDATQQCINSDDDAGDGFNSRLTFTLPARTSGELVVWPFQAGDRFNFQLSFTSTAPIAVLAP